MIIELLRGALDARLILEFDYDEKHRLVEPHALGLNKKGELLLRAFQTNCEPPAWKLFVLERATTITMRNDLESHAPRPGYKVGDRAMMNIFAELPEPEQVEQAA